MHKQTKGEYRVGATFNPSALTTVDDIKSAAAALIDLIEAIPSDYNTDQGIEVIALKGIAQRAVENGAMWAVKAATKPERI